MALASPFLCFCLFCGTVCASALNVPLSQPVLGYGLTNAFPGLRFDRPVVIASPPGETNRLFIAEKGGRIIVLNDLSHPTTSVFLDLSASTFVSEEAGLLGLAFHPNYRENGRFFVFKISAVDASDELLEFKCDPPGALAADPNSLKVLISQADASDTHNAGDLKFGPDGYLYLSLGDESPPFPDRHDSPQAINKGFFGGIIRIDVDSKPENLLPNSHPAVRGGYRVPQENPFIGATMFNGERIDPAKVRTEFYAVGMRNPWRFTFDPFTGELICGDVGSGAIEEIDVVQKGGNYGWPYMEGSRVAMEGPLPPGLQLPIYEYEHGIGGLFNGRVIIGGLVYAGREIPLLRGKYLFGDYDSGNIWAIDLAGPNPKPVWLTSRTGTAAFGIDPASGEVLVANHMEGRIERLTYQTAAEADVPLTLSEVNAFSDLSSLTPQTNLLPYEVNTPLWSDGAVKQRWIDLRKATGKVVFKESVPWEFPSGTVFIKHFELELTNDMPASRRRIETRLLVKTADDDVFGLTYRWGDSLKDARLVPPSGTNESFTIVQNGVARTQLWHYPSWDECRTCHNREAGFILGVRTDQLNRTIETDGQPTNQLDRLAAHGVFADSTDVQPAHLRRLAALDDAVAPLEYRVRSYLQANCVQCHQPGARSAALWDARIATPFAQSHILNVPAVFYLPPMKIIAPHDPENSYVYLRAKTRSPLFQMPPLATSIPDQKFVDLLSDWISRIPGPEWKSANFGASLAEGSAELAGDGLRISSAGTGLTNESFFFCGRTASGASELSASLSSLDGPLVSAEAGLMFRASLEADAPAAALVRQGGNLCFYVKARGPGKYALVRSVPRSQITHLKLASDRKTVSAWTADNLPEWQVLATAAVDLGAEYLAGFAIASGDASQFATAHFEQLLSVDQNRADSDGDGFSDILEYCLGYDPVLAVDKPNLTYGLNNDSFEVKLTRRKQAEDATLLVESSTDLSNWNPIAPSSVDSNFDPEEVTWRIAMQNQAQQFIRFSVETR
jgi:glucose/arabinose dehydrogenase